MLTIVDDRNLGCALGASDYLTKPIALERLREATPGLILLDLMMPEMDGFELVVELRKHEAWREIPVVVATAKDLTADDRQRLNGYVGKVLQKAAARRATR